MFRDMALRYINFVHVITTYTIYVSAILVVPGLAFALTCHFFHSCLYALIMAAIAFMYHLPIIFIGLPAIFLFMILVYFITLPIMIVFLSNPEGFARAVAGLFQPVIDGLEPLSNIIGSPTMAILILVFVSVYFSLILSFHYILSYWRSYLEGL